MYQEKRMGMFSPMQQQSVTPNNQSFGMAGSRDPWNTGKLNTGPGSFAQRHQNDIQKNRIGEMNAQSGLADAATNQYKAETLRNVADNQNTIQQQWVKRLQGGNTPSPVTKGYNAGTKIGSGYQTPASPSLQSITGVNNFASNLGSSYNTNLSGPTQSMDAYTGESLSDTPYAQNYFNSIPGYGLGGNN